MASADYSVGTKVTADVSNFEKGMNKAEKSLKGFSDKLANSIDRLGKKGLIGSVANVTLAMQGLTKSFNTVIKFAKDVGKAINECTEAYKGQIIAERALDTAIQNNPFVSGASSKALKEFASEMQKVSNYGDEELIPMMTNLVSLGRTESEVMQIMSVAMDMSAGMGISLDTAITQLNATLNGNIGRLGQQNAELKGLTEEELKQGKAIEILGEKFKGLSGATADTSKQLQNIKGDFKEALGQFTLPSSDMWNKFWAGFYERGIEVIGKINAYIDAQTIGRRLAGDIVNQLKNFTAGDIGGRTDYIRGVLKAITDEELNALGNYLGNLKKLNTEQDQLLRRIKAEQDARYQNSINAKKEAEEKKKQAVAEEKITAEVQKQEEVAKKKTDWASKLLDQRIEMLETERDRAMQFAEEEGKETYTIWIDYNEKILELKLERLEKEKAKALEEEGLTAEDKVNIEEYYSGETKKIYDELGDYKKKKGKEEGKDEKSKFAIMLEYAKQYAQKIKQIFSKVVSTIKNVFSSVTNIFKKLFDFNIDDALNAILKWEDNILTFFVETLPALPNFVKSVVQSIKKLLKSIKNVLKGLDLKAIILDILKTLSNNLPEIVSEMLDILVLIINDAVNGLVQWLGQEQGLKMLLDVVLKIQQGIEKVVTDNIDTIVDFLADNVDTIAEFLAQSMKSANRTLPKIIKAILKLIKILLDVIAKAFSNQEFVDSIVESLEETINAIIEILPSLVQSFVNLIYAIIKAIIPKLPEIIRFIVDTIVGLLENNDDGFFRFLEGVIDGIIALISGLIEALTKDNTLGKALGNIISSLFKKVMDFDFWVDVLSSMVRAFAQSLSTALSGMNFSNLLGLGGGSGGGGGGSSGGDEWGIDDYLDPLGHLLGVHAIGTNNAQRGLALVGEAGPELVKFNGGEQVLNNRNTNKALANMGGNTNNFNVTFNNLQDTTAFNMMQQLKAYNRQMAINGVI